MIQLRLEDDWSDVERPGRSGKSLKIRLDHPLIEQTVLMREAEATISALRETIRALGKRSH